MKYLKILGLAAIAAAALMAFAGSASATTLTSPAGTALPAGTEIKSENEGTVTLHPPFGDIECSSSKVAGKTTNAGGAGVAVNGNIETLTFSSCNATVTVLTKGTLSIESSGSNKGALTGAGQEVTVEFFGTHCIFSTKTGTPLGTLTGSTEPESGKFTDATLDIEATIPRTGGRSGAFCGSTAQWTGAYKVTSPTPLFID